MLGIYPPDEFGLYEAPVTTITALVALAAPVQAIGPDPSRVVMMLTGDGINTMFIAPAGSAALANGQGLAIAPSVQPLILTQATHGTLAQLAWVASAGVNATITVVTLSLLRNPAIYGYRNLFHGRAATEPARPLSRRRAASSGGLLRRPVALPRFLRERIPGILAEA